MSILKRFIDKEQLDYGYYLKKKGRTPWIGIDLDGTLSILLKNGQSGPPNYKIGDPIEPMISIIRKLIEEQWTVKIFTARPEHNWSNIRRWLMHTASIPILEITNKKDGSCFCYFDDMAVRIERNKGCVEEKE